MRDTGSAITIAATDGGRLADNVAHFARVLRTAGLPIGSGKIVDALTALQLAGITRRDDFYWTLATVFVDRHAQQPLFDQAFHAFWRDPALLERVMQLLLPRAYGRTPQPSPQLARRVAEALAPQAHAAPRDESEPMMEFDAALTFSAHEQLRQRDFESMSSDELAQARAAIARFRLPVADVTTRRFTPNAHGANIDLRASMRASLRGGAAAIVLRRRSRVRRPPPVVALVDISGSMSRYSRLFLHFLHTLTAQLRQVHTLTFGTRLTPITRQLRHRDVDEALAGAGRDATDWSGGTRIGACIETFNRNWSRRLLAQNAVVLLFSDGLDRDDAVRLAQQMERLHKSCRALIWLNPLLRYAGFEAKAAGIRAMLPHVDRFLPAHNLDSFAQLADLLGGGPPQSGGRVSTTGETRWK
ncbi:MAG TPA: VWA domain-containing protein [Burkholderiales bacterium]|jgi:uncharacterized protein with von Willebrand factor type A (vWA) domain|nr:VWA domain-containing protein [Burkholderiales bacterium]